MLSVLLQALSSVNWVCSKERLQLATQDLKKFCVGANMKDARSIVDGNIVTANGPSSTLNLGYEILKIEKDRQTAEKTMQDMLLFPKQQTYFF